MMGYSITGARLGICNAFKSLVRPAAVLYEQAQLYASDQAHGLKMLCEVRTSVLPSVSPPTTNTTPHYQGMNSR